MNVDTRTARNVVCISGTSRPGNYTAKALAVITDELARRHEACRIFDARDLQLGFPGLDTTPDAALMQQAVAAASGVIIASPEYHGGICAHTKLIIENLGFPSVLAGKPVAVVGVAAGRIGAIKSLEQLKGIISHVGGLVIPGSISIAGVRQVFDEEGNCLDEGSDRALRGVAEAMGSFLDDFVCPRFALESMVRNDSRPWVTSL